MVTMPFDTKFNLRSCGRRDMPRRNTAHSTLVGDTNVRLSAVCSMLRQAATGRVHPVTTGRFQAHPLQRLVCGGEPGTGSVMSRPISDLQLSELAAAKPTFE